MEMWKCPVCSNHRKAFQLTCTCDLYTRTLDEANAFNKIHNPPIFVPVGSTVYWMTDGKPIIATTKEVSTYSKIINSELGSLIIPQIIGGAIGCGIAIWLIMAFHL